MTFPLESKLSVKKKSQLLLLPPYWNTAELASSWLLFSQSIWQRTLCQGYVVLGHSERRGKSVLQEYMSWYLWAQLRSKISMDSNLVPLSSLWMAVQNLSQNPVTVPMHKADPPPQFTQHTQNSNADIWSRSLYLGWWHKVQSMKVISIHSSKDPFKYFK